MKSLLTLSTVVGLLSYEAVNGFILQRRPASSLPFAASSNGDSSSSSVRRSSPARLNSGESEDRDARECSSDNGRAPTTKEPVVHEAGLLGLGGLASGFLGPPIGPTFGAPMEDPRILGVEVPRSVYLTWQEVEEKTRTIRSKATDILAQSETRGGNGDMQVDVEKLTQLLTKEAEDLLQQLKVQLGSLEDVASSALATVKQQVDHQDVDQVVEVVKQVVLEALSKLDEPIMWGSERLTNLAGEVLPASLSSHETVQSLLKFLKLVATDPSIRLETEGVLSALLSTVVVLLTIKATASGEPSGLSLLLTSDPALPTRYDVAALQKYYQARPNLVFGRLASVLSQSSSFLVGLASDYLGNRMEQNEAKRAVQLKELITALGPVFIKVGQLMSVRPDLVGPEYLKQLQLLQDQVPPFSSKDALDMIEAQLPPGVTATDVFRDLSCFDSPVAAASLGQVYRATLKDEASSVVAVKVQRPRMLEAVTLDLYAARLAFSAGTGIAPIARQCREIIAILDTWGSRFMEELDYLQEAQNSKVFTQSMQGNAIITKSILIPQVYDRLTSRGVLVSEWIDGRKLSSFRQDVEAERACLTQVVQVLLNAYLIQLLETGYLHSDPHPGNFLVTRDNRLCILDFGLMTSLEEDKRIALVEYVAHLTAKDYNATVIDLTRLGFIPKEIATDETKRNIVAPVLGQVLEQLSAGGGAKAVNVEEIGAQVEVLAKQYPITLPAWFALIIRTFSALEGLGLSLDDRYSIVQGCYPYLARRLLTDDSPRIRAALRSFLYGSDNLLKVDRVNEMVEAYREFNEAFGEFIPEAAAQTKPASATQGFLEFDQSSLEALKIIFAKDDNYVQELVVEEMVRMTDAAIREVTGLVARTARATPLSLLDLLPRIRRGPLGNLITLPLLPLVTLLSIFSSMMERAETLSQLTNEDRESLKTLRRLLGLVNDSIGGLPRVGAPTSNSRTLPQLPFPPVVNPAQLLQTASAAGSAYAPILAEVAPGAVEIGRKFLRQLTGRILSRLADELAGPASV